MKRFGEKVRTLRKWQGLSQSELGAELGVAQSFVARVENGRQKPSVDLILKFSYFFQVSADLLMKDELELEE